MSPTPTSVSVASRPLLDTRYKVETPEGIDLILRPAGLVPRALAFSIDLLIRGALLGALFAVLALLGQFGMGLGTILLFLVTWWYMVLFEVLNQGRSPGKQMMGLRVIHDDGTPIGWAASLTRNLLRFVDILPFGYTLGILSCLNHPAFKRLGDIAAGTLVVYRDNASTAPELPQAEALRAPFTMSLSEQRACSVLPSVPRACPAHVARNWRAFLPNLCRCPQNKLNSRSTVLPVVCWGRHETEPV